MTTYKDLQIQVNNLESFIRNNPDRMDYLYRFFDKYVEKHGYDFADIQDRLFSLVQAVFAYDYKIMTDEKVHIHTIYKVTVSLECDMEERYK